MHYSQQHDYDGNPGANNGTGGGLAYSPKQATLGNGPNEYLLRNVASDLCLSCHDNQDFAPDVLGANTGTHVRQAGGLNKIGYTGAYAEYKGHTLGTEHPNVPGSSCLNCHPAHGGPLTAVFSAGVR